MVICQANLRCSPVPSPAATIRRSPLQKGEAGPPEALRSDPRLRYAPEEPSGSMIGYVLRTGFLGVLLALMAHYLVGFMLYLDLNKRAYNHVPGQCSSVAGIEHGAVDMELLPNGNAIVTTGTKFYNSTDYEDKASEVKGGIFIYNATSKTAWEVRLDSKTLTYKTFNPHGIALLVQGKGILVFVVNHRKRGDTVEVFKLKDGGEAEKTIVHVRTVKSKAFYNLHDVLPVTPDKFYVTRYHYFRDERLQNLELYFSLRLGSVLYFDGKNASVALDHIGTPSGLALDKGKKWLYVASLTGEKLLVAKINEDYSLTLNSEIPLATSPQHVSVDPLTADLYVAAHPVKSRMFRHTSLPKSIYSPSQVLKLHGRPTKTWTITGVYQNDGATLSASSSVLKHKDKLMIGSLHDKMLACELEAPQLL